MYNLTRQEAASILKISTRSIDRYIKSGKLRSKKDGKVVYINEDDIKNISGGNKGTHEIIVPKSSREENKQSLDLTSNSNSTMVNKIYEDIKEDVRNKDKKIQELSIQLGRMEEIAKNSISMIEFKKSQFILEESKTSLNNEVATLKSDLESNKEVINKERNLSAILLSLSIVFFIIMISIWFIKI